jgi:acyl-coenzyme A synthetase/AMP-(fatty) acid ligase
MLRAMGVKPGAKVLLMIPPSPALIASLLGAMKAGAVPVLGVAPDDADALKRCIAITTPSAVVIHQDYVTSAEDGLSSLPPDCLVVIGSDVQGRRSFMDAIRGQPSWFSAEPVGGDSPAIGLWSGSTLRLVGHAELAQIVAGTGSLGEDPENYATRLMTMLRSFSRGEEAVLR